MRRHDKSILSWIDGLPVSQADARQQAAELASLLPEDTHPVVNLCQNRHYFLVAFLAALLTRRCTILPPSSAPETITDCAASFPAVHNLDDNGVQKRLRDAGSRPTRRWTPPVDEQLAVRLFTSGSTGTSRGHNRCWHHLLAGARALEEGLMLDQPHHLLATVPPQHTFGLETSVMLPLLGGHAVDNRRPLFPEDVRAALGNLPRPRGLITTPLHLRSCLADDRDWPDVSFVLSATAPLEHALAVNAEHRLTAPVYEIYGSTETGALAIRRPAHEELWRPLPGVELGQQANRIHARGAHFPDCTLSDALEFPDDRGRFRLLGRDQDIVKVAGKRGSLDAIQRALRNAPGVLDCVVLPPPQGRENGRVRAVIVAPGCSSASIRKHLRKTLDPVLIPRPMIHASSLPRNETGKLPAAALSALLSQLGIEQ